MKPPQASLEMQVPARLQEVDCPGCASTGPFQPATKRNGYAVVRCPRCESHFVNPRPTGSYLTALYRRYEEVLMESGVQLSESDPWSERAAAYHLARLRRHASGGRLLDLGCGDGSLLLEARPFFQACGLDLAPRLRREAEELPVVMGDFHSLPFRDDKFAVATALEVLEHLVDPRAALLEIRRVLRPGGILLVQTGDASTPLPQMALSRWAYLQPPVHLNFLSRNALHRLLRDIGYKIVDTWSFGRAPGRLSLVPATKGVEVLRPIFDLAARWGLLGQAYVGRVPS